MKRKLLFAVLCTIAALGMRAQNPGDDYTSSITNPTFTGNADGWTIDGQARYFNGKGFDGTASFIELTNWGSSWDATISQTVTVPNGYYRVKAAGQMSGTADCWMKLVANGAESRFSRNGDTNGNILADGTETTIGSGVAGWRYTSVIAKVTDGSLEISCVGHSNVKERWANFDHVTLTFLGTEIPANTDVTEFINNWDFWGCFNDEFNGWTISKTGGNSWVHGNTAVEHWSDDMSRTFDYYQTINNLPEGRYQISASMWNTQGTPNGNSGVYGTSNDVTVFAGVTDDCGDTNLHTYTTDGIFVNNGTLRVGVKNNGARSSNWFGVDWIKLQYKGKVVADYALPLPDGGAMAADTWYYFDIAVAGNDYMATATTLGDIICVADANTLTSAAVGTVTLTETDNNFSVQRYYVKSSSANNLEIGVASYTYTVSAATADKAYIQPGQTVIVSYTVSTNDPGATLTQDYSGVTFNDAAISVTPTASGFTFTVPAVTENAEYTLAIPTGAIKYNEDNKNAAQNITLNTPALFDGIYFLKVAATYDGSSEGTSAAVGKYLARGMNYGTHATLDKYGLPLQISTDANNATSIQAFDTKRYFFHGNTYDCWADQTPLAESGKFTVTLNNGKYMLHNNSMAAGTYLKYNTSAAGDANIAVYDDGNGTNNGPIIMWTTEDASTHASVMQGYKDTQAAAAAAAAYASGNYASLNGISTVAALEAELTANYIEGVFVAPSPIESISEKYQGGQPGAGNVTETVYSNTINITQPGFYKFSMQAFYRAGSNDVTQAMHTAGIDFPPVVLFFGDSEAQIKSIYDEGGLDQGVADGYFETETVGGAPVQYNSKWYTNGQHNSVIIFQKDYYHNDVWFYASEPGEYSYGVKYMGWACANMQWFIYSPESVTITSYAAAADDDDYTALTSAINAYDNATWGFENGEYAPYNNAEAIANIAAARAINSSETNSKLLVNSLTAKLALTVNATDVDAIYNGLFATVAAGQNYPDGWTRTNDWGQMQSGISGDFATAYYNQPGSLQYGNQGVYTMPLAANQEYKLTFSYRSQEDNSNTGMTVSVLNSSDGLGATAFEGNGSTSAWKTASAYFTTGAAGNYVLTLGNDGNTWITNVSLVKVASTELELSEEDAYTPELAYYETVSLARNIAADTWSTFVVPFDIDNTTLKAKFGDDVRVSEFSADDKTGLTFTPMAEPAITANTPVLVKTSSNKRNFTFSGVTIKEGTPTISQNGVNFVGNYGGVIAIPNTLDTYFVKSNTIKKSTGAQKLKGFRAYFTVDADSPVKAFFENDIFIDDEATGIVNLNDNLNKNEAIYNLAGQRVQKAQKGLYIVNGRKVVVK